MNANKYDYFANDVNGYNWFEYLWEEYWRIVWNSPSITLSWF